MTDIRKASSELFQWCLNGLVNKCKVVPLEEPHTQQFMKTFVNLLDKAVVDLTRSSFEYFEVLFAYANLVNIYIFFNQ
jgi:hypothetical protein